MPEGADAAIVSVVIPAYNHAAYVDDALQSVCAQTYTRWECVVVDDGSTDLTRAIVEGRASRDARIRYALQANAGPSAARNAGLSLTTGDLVQLLDADDVLGPRKLERHVRIFAENPAADLVYGRSRYFAGPVQTYPPPTRDWLADRGRATPSGSGTTLVAALLDDNIMVVEAPLLRRKLMDRVGGFDPGLRTMEDWDLWLRCALAGAVFIFDPSNAPGTLAFVRAHEENSSRDTVAMVRSELAIRSRLAADLQDTVLVTLNRRRFHQGLARIGLLEGARGDLTAGMRSLIRAGRAERRVQWLAMGAVLPALRLPLVQRTIRVMRTLRRRAQQGHHTG